MIFAVEPASSRESGSCERPGRAQGTQGNQTPAHPQPQRKMGLMEPSVGQLATLDLMWTGAESRGAARSRSNHREDATLLRDASGMHCSLDLRQSTDECLQKKVLKERDALDDRSICTSASLVVWVICMNERLAPTDCSPAAWTRQGCCGCGSKSLMRRWANSATRS